MNNTTTKEQEHLIDYYEAMEDLLALGRETTGNHRTHFGMLEEMDDKYDWFKTITTPNIEQQNYQHVLRGMDNLHKRLFPNDLRKKSILDVGCGSGGTMKFLSIDNPTSTVHGININEKQLAIGEEHLSSNNNATLYHGNIYDFDFDQKYDLIYFIESAFHMKQKELLAQVVSHNLKEGGEVYFVDIFYPENLWKRIGSKQTQEDIFHYLPISEWNLLLERKGLEVSEYDDISLEVSNFLKVRSTEEEFKKHVLNKVLHDVVNLEVSLRNIMEAYQGYVKLQRLFAKGMLQYGILRAIKK